MAAARSRPAPPARRGAAADADGRRGFDLPAALGYCMPAEWEQHRATWLAWPHERRDWPGKFTLIPWVYAEFVRQVAPAERVCILVNDAATERRARAVLGRAGADLGAVDFFRVATDRSWTRDTCPIFVRRAAAGTGPVTGGGAAASGDADVAITDWKFNGWAKYANHRRDDAVPGRLAKRLRLRRFVPQVVTAPLKSRQVVLEGGSIDVDGAGTLLTTEECLLSPIQARNPGMSRQMIEKVLGDYLGIRHVLWLGRGIAGDDTHGHVDDLARFVGPRTVAIAQEPNGADENHAPLAENRERLSGMRNAAGERLEIVALPMPAPVVFEGIRLPASYANFYIANQAVLVPTFNDPADRQALGVIAELFPQRKVIGIHALDLVWGLGTLHCMTQQEPASPPQKASEG